MARQKEQGVDYYDEDGSMAKVSSGAHYMRITHQIVTFDDGAVIKPETVSVTYELGRYIIITADDRIKDGRDLVDQDSPPPLPTTNPVKFYYHDAYYVNPSLHGDPIVTVWNSKDDVDRDGWKKHTLGINVVNEAISYCDIRSASILQTVEQVDYRPVLVTFREQILSEAQTPGADGVSITLDIVSFIPTPAGAGYKVVSTIFNTFSLILDLPIDQIDQSTLDGLTDDTMNELLKRANSKNNFGTKFYYPSHKIVQYED